MGIPMNRDLHSPTVVPAGPSSSHPSSTVGANASLASLAKQKENLEAELSALGSVLDSHGVNMSTSLTTFDGFPRSDVDVAQIRTTRARIIRLRNDWKVVMGRIEKAVEEGFAKGEAVQDGTQASRPTPRAASSVNGAEASSSRPAVEPPFARVNSVVPSSPAEAAGLRAGDKITRFGAVHWQNHEKLSRVAQVVQQNENRPITVKLLREATTVEVQLTPRRDWGGRGLLGCHLLPV